MPYQQQTSTRRSKADRKAERNQKLRKLLVEATQCIIDDMPPPEVVSEIRATDPDAASVGSMMLISFNPPSKEKIIGDDGTERLVPLYPAHCTHFAGYKGRAADPIDHSQGGVPWVSLIQGFRSKTTGNPDPDSTLPAGKTVIDLLNERALSWTQGDLSKAMCFRTLFRRKVDGQLVNRLEIHLVWDTLKWKEWRSVHIEAASQRKLLQEERGGGGGAAQISYSDYLEQEKKQKTKHR
jgi:hypothetical protein